MPTQDPWLNSSNEQKTEFESLERQIRSLQAANQEKNQFLQRAIHDLKNPLSSIVMSAEFLASGVKMGVEERREMVKVISQESERMSHLLASLMEVVKIDQGKVELQSESVRLGKILTAVTEDYARSARAKGQKLTLDLPEKEAEVVVDGEAVTRVFQQLLSNAIKYTPLQGEIRVGMEMVDQKVRALVEDNGPGLAAEDQGQLFERFCRLNSRPTGGENSAGLGLSIAKFLVEKMGGRMWCESELGKGSRFLVEFPVR